MKKCLVIFISMLISATIFAQSPNAFSYQAVVRNSSGTVIPNQNVSFRINILQGSSTGLSVYSEEHSATTNPFGLVNLEIGNGTNPSGNFSTIDWGNNTYYIKVELDINAGNNYTVMGTNQLLSVPYALYSPGNYKAGNGISILNDTIKNTSPNQLVTLTNGSGISITGPYPDFTIFNTNPDQTITLTGMGATTVTGTYPDFTINSIDNNTIYHAGNGIDISNDTLYNTAPDKVVTLNGTGATTVTGTYPDFTIFSTDNNTTYSAGAGLSLTGSVFDAVFGTSAGMIAEGDHTHSDYMAGGSNGNIQFNNNGIFGGNTNLFWDNANSRLGIGTSNPTTSLHLNGTLRITDDSESAGKILTSDTNGVCSWQSPAIGSSNGNANYIPKFITPNSLGNSLLYQNGNYIGLGNSNPLGRFIIKGDSLSSDTVPLFEVQDKNGKTVFVVWPDGAHVYVKDSSSNKSQNKGCFAVSGRGSSKSLDADNYFKISSAGSLDTVSGARILWYPKKEAFLTGRVLVESPDSIGTNSMATGYNSKAKGNCSQALGYQATALGNYSTAIGIYAHANSDNSFAFGDSVTAGSPSASNCYAFGKNSKATGDESYALGSQAQATQQYAYAFGAGATAQGTASYAFGTGASAQGPGCFAFGSLGNGVVFTDTTGTLISATTTTLASGNSSLAFGQGSQSTADGAVSVGISNYAANSNSIAMGYSCNATGIGANAIGYSCFASGNYSTAIGHNISSTSYGCFVVGQQNISFGDATTWVDTDPIFIIGNGNSGNIAPIGDGFIVNRHNALVVLKNGNVGIGTITPPTQKLTVNGNICYTGIIGACSDKRYKKNITHLENSLSYILQLQGVNYYWKTEEFPDNGFSNEKQIGFIAQDIEKVYPEVVITDNSGYKSVDYPRLTPILVEAIKEQQKQMDTLQKENSLLKSDNTLLKNDNTQLRYEIQSIKVFIGMVKK
ncbi:MAG: tail fiber domain-containing protein [Bacteroidia bacterium]|nr:tail fiber domain-containing protein [Bacteroidia bacterium]